MGEYKFRGMFELHNAGLKEPSPELQAMDEKWKNMFQLVTPLFAESSLVQRKQAVNPTVYTFVAPTYETKLSWMNEIDDCISQLQEVRTVRLRESSFLLPFFSVDYDLIKER